MDIDKIVLEGLSSYPKYLPSWYRYDKQGSILNDICIEQSNWYYFHRFEEKLLKQITRVSILKYSFWGIHLKEICVMKFL